MAVIQNFRDNFIDLQVWNFHILQKFHFKKNPIYLIEETLVLQTWYFKDIFLILIDLSIISISTTRGIWQVVD